MKELLAGGVAGRPGAVRTLTRFDVTTRLVDIEGQCDAYLY
ncbi:hypothetical protein BH11PSE8_BH11PSE8_24410 [soil metagenome]